MNRRGFIVGGIAAAVAAVFGRLTGRRAEAAPKGPTGAAEEKTLWVIAAEYDVKTGGMRYSVRELTMRGDKVLAVGREQVHECPGETWVSGGAWPCGGLPGAMPVGQLIQP